MYWATTTAPPVAKAENKKRNRLFKESTKAMAETAVSPTEATIRVSANPTETSSNLSITIGKIKIANCLFENKRGFKKGGFSCCN